MTWHGIILVSKYVWYLRCLGWSSWNQWTIGLFQPEWSCVKEHEKGGKQWKWLEGGLFLIVIYGRLSKQLWHWCLLALVIHCTLLTLTVHSTFEIQPCIKIPKYTTSNRIVLHIGCFAIILQHFFLLCEIICKHIDHPTTLQLLLWQHTFCDVLALAWTWVGGVVVISIAQYCSLC